MAAVSKYVSDFTVELLLLNCTGSLVGVKRTGLTKETGFVSVCPSCESPTKVGQRYLCPECEGLFNPGDLRKAKEISKGTLAFVDDAEIKAARQSDLPTNLLELTVHNAADVEAFTYPSDASYVFYPKAATQQYAVLAELVGDPELAFVGFCNLRNHEKLLRLRRWGSNLVVQTLFTPEELNAREDMDLGFDEKYRKVLDIISNDVADFEPESYKNRQRERLAAIAGGEPVARPAAASKDSDAAALDKLLEMLEQRQVQ